jgi:K+-transporting ATPase KdpF subunit
LCRRRPSGRRPAGLKAGRDICRGEIMTLDYVIGLIVTAGLLVYLTYALLRPEKF